MILFARQEEPQVNLSNSSKKLIWSEETWKKPSQALEWLPKLAITLRKQNIVSKYPTAGSRGKGSQHSAIMNTGFLHYPKNVKGLCKFNQRDLKGSPRNCKPSKISFIRKKSPQSLSVAAAVST